jgi:hypothetical protein
MCGMAIVDETVNWMLVDVDVGETKRGEGGVILGGRRSFLLNV